MAYGKLAWLTKDELEELYLRQHLTMQEIGDMYEVTRAAVMKALDRNGVDKSQGERFDHNCAYCKEVFSTTRKRFKSVTGHYCSAGCYHKHRRKAGRYKPSRQGCRIARKVMVEHLGRELNPEEVVHHEDGDNNNNDLDNVILFISQSEHLRYHHQRRMREVAEAEPDMQCCGKSMEPTNNDEDTYLCLECGCGKHKQDPTHPSPSQ